MICLQERNYPRTIFVEREISCSTDACPVLTKISVPKSFDCAKPFICGFCAIHKQNELKNYLSVLLDNLTKENKGRSWIARQIRQEQNEQESKKLSLVIKGTAPSSSTNDEECVQKLAQTIDIVLDSADIETKGIGKISEQNGKQLLFVKLKSQIKREQFLRNLIKLRDNAFYSSVFVDLDLTKSEREAQYQLRVEKRTLQEKFSEKVFVIKNGKVIEKR